MSESGKPERDRPGLAESLVLGFLAGAALVISSWMTEDLPGDGAPRHASEHGMPRHMAD